MARGPLSSAKAFVPSAIIGRDAVFGFQMPTFAEGVTLLCCPLAGGPFPPHAAAPGQCAGSNFGRSSLAVAEDRTRSGSLSSLGRVVMSGQFGSGGERGRGWARRGCCFRTKAHFEPAFLVAMAPVYG